MTRRTIRRYAYEHYPHADECEVRPLETEVPALLAEAVGLTVSGTGWMEVPHEGVARMSYFLAAAEVALLADALHQGMVGDEAWRWAACGGSGEVQHEMVFERAAHYGVPIGRIKPYDCGPEPQVHWHMASTGDATGHGEIKSIDCPESECETCTEEVEATS